MLEKHAAVVGMGQLGRTFAEGMLLGGYTVTPVLRGRPIPVEWQPAPVIVATGEDDLAQALAHLPAGWRDSRVLVLLQNELLPTQWRPLGIDQPTILVVWFERKPGKPITQLIPSVVFGPQQEAIAQAMDYLQLGCTQAHSEREILLQLVIKNAYIWTTNIASLAVGGTTGELWEKHRDLAQRLIREAVGVQAALIGEPFDPEAVRSRVQDAMVADPDHKAGGRSARRRLERFLAHAHTAGIEVAGAEEIAAAAGVVAKP